MYYVTYLPPEYLCSEWVRFDVFFRACRNFCSSYNASFGERRSGLIVLKALVHLGPKRIAIRDGYFGVHNTIRVYRKINPAVVSAKWFTLGRID